MHTSYPIWYEMERCAKDTLVLSAVSLWVGFWKQSIECQLCFWIFCDSWVVIPSIFIHTKIAELCVHSVHDTHHFTMQWASSIAKATTRPETQSSTKSERHVLFPMKASGLPNTCVTHPSTTSAKVSSDFSPEMHIAFTPFATSLDTWSCISEIRGDTTTTTGDLNICEGLQERVGFPNRTAVTGRQETCQIL